LQTDHIDLYQMHHIQRSHAAIDHFSSLTPRGDASMAAWTSAELTSIGAAEELRIASLRHDDTLRKPVIIWVVRHGDDLYVRSVNGPMAAWFPGAQERREGHIWVGGIEKDVTFVDADDDISDALDAAYQTKYRHTPSSVSHITSPAARSATLRPVPR